MSDHADLFGHFPSDSDSDSDGETLTDFETIQSWFLGAIPFHKPETLKRELKEYRIFQLDDDLSEDTIRDMFIHNDFHQLVRLAKYRLDNMINRYIPKYFTAFMNTKIRQAELIFGLTDDGEVTGVLVDSLLTKNDILLKVWDQIDTCIMKCFSNNPTFCAHYLKHIRSNVDVNIVEISTRPEDIMVDDWSEVHLEQQQARNDEIESVFADYKKKMHMFTNHILHYRRSINKMLNDPIVRKELSEFIHTFTTDQYTITDTSRDTVIRIVKGIDDVSVTFAPGQIMDEKDDPNKLAFWITKFRDYRVNKIQAQKPVTPIQRTTPLYTSLLLKNPVARIATSIHDATHSKMAVIQIILPGYNSISLPPGYDYHPRFSYQYGDEIKSPIRCITSNGPSCV